MDLGIIHNTAGHYESPRDTLCCEIAEILCLCQALTWTPLQSPPLRAAILERLAWAEIADDGQRCVVRSQHGSYLKSGGVGLIVEKKNIQCPSLLGSEDCLSGDSVCGRVYLLVRAVVTAH